MVTPVTSEGSRSGVNWMRLLDPWTVAARALAREVLPVPGASSKRTWPSASIAVKVRRMTWALPRTAWPTLATSFSNVPANQAACSLVMVISCFLFRVIPDVFVLGRALAPHSALLAGSALPDAGAPDVHRDALDVPA